MARGARQEADPPECTRWGWRFHHLGVPTSQERPDERHLDQFGFSVSGFQTSTVGVEWMRFDPDSPIDPLIQQVPHLAFVVDDLHQELATRNLTVLTPPNQPSDGVRVAMVVIDGAPVELLEFNDPDEQAGADVDD